MAIQVRRILPALSVALLLGVGLWFAQTRTLTGAAAEAGCSGIGSLVDLDSARNEARYVPFEVAAVVGVGMAVTYQYSSVGTEALASAVAGEGPSVEGCEGVEVTETPSITGRGEVVFDLSSCSNQSGRVVLRQSELDLVELPPDEGGGSNPGDPDLPQDIPEDIPEDIPGELPEDLPEDLENLDQEDIEDLVGELAGELGNVEASLDYEGYKNQFLSLDGTFSLSLAEGGGQAGMELSASFSIPSVINYSGTAALTGPSTVDPETGSSTLNLDGTFVTATGMSWELIVDDLVLDPACMGAKSGQITGIWEGDAGRVDVLAEFDGDCDGCYNVQLDGQPAGEVCIPDWIVGAIGS